MCPHAIFLEAAASSLLRMERPRRRNPRKIFADGRNGVGGRGVSGPCGYGKITRAAICRSARVALRNYDNDRPAVFGGPCAHKARRKSCERPGQASRPAVGSRGKRRGVSCAARCAAHPRNRQSYRGGAQSLRELRRSRNLLPRHRKNSSRISAGGARRCTARRAAATRTNFSWTPSRNPSRTITHFHSTREDRAALDATLSLLVPESDEAAARRQPQRFHRDAHDSLRRV